MRSSGVAGAPFEECLNDLDWLGPSGVALFIARAEDLLVAAPDDLRTFLSILELLSKPAARPGAGRRCDPSSSTASPPTS